MNHTCLSEMSAILDKLDTMLKVQNEVLKSEGNGLDERGPLMGRVVGLRTATIGALKGCEYMLMTRMRISFVKNKILINIVQKWARSSLLSI
jgi:hypothetical protein